MVLVAEIILRKRYGPQWFRVNQLIQPDDWMVEQVVQQDLAGATVHQVWDWVITHITYPWGRIAWSDWHQMAAFWKPTLWGRTARFRYRQVDFWSYPGEVLRDRMDDCKGSAVLLTSLLRHWLSSDQVFMSVGYYDDPRGRRHLHAWTTIFLHGKPIALDGTYPHPLPDHEWIREHPHYQPFWRANDVRTLLIQPTVAQRVYGRSIRLLEASATSRAKPYATG